MRHIRYIISATALLCLVSCSEIKFGDKFLGDRPESSGADIDTMFNSAVNAEKVLTKATPTFPTDFLQIMRRVRSAQETNLE